MVKALHSLDLTPKALLRLTGANIAERLECSPRPVSGVAAGDEMHDSLPSAAKCDAGWPPTERVRDLHRSAPLSANVIYPELRYLIAAVLYITVQRLPWLPLARGARNEGIEAGDARPPDVADVPGHQRQPMDAGGRGEPQVDDRHGANRAEPPPLLRDGSIDRKNPVCVLPGLRRASHRSRVPALPGSRRRTASMPLRISPTTSTLRRSSSSATPENQVATSTLHRDPLRSSDGTFVSRR